MNQIDNVPSTNKFYFRQSTKRDVQSDKKNSYLTKQSIAGFGVGVGLTALAASGIVLMRNRGVQSLSQNPQQLFESVEEVFGKIKKAPSMMEILKNSKLTPKNFKQVLFNITSDEELGEKFIKEVTSNPRKSKEHVRLLTKKIGGEKELKDWMLHTGGYQEAYYRHTHNLYNTPNIGPDTLIKESPNWNIWKMKAKFGNDFCIGQPPKVFNGVDNYRNIFEQMTKDGNTQRTFGGVTLAEELKEGASGKAVVRFDADGKKYILKYQKSDRWHNNMDIRDDLSMKSDSTFLNAQLDRYLSLNGNTQGPRLVFFDYKTNSAIYEMTEGKKPQLEDVNDILKVNDKFEDLNSLGVYYNDVNADNIRILENGEYNFIDSGESSFVDFFKPGVADLHFDLPNLNGRSITDTSAALHLANA